MDNMNNSKYVWGSTRSLLWAFGPPFEEQYCLEPAEGEQNIVLPVFTKFLLTLFSFCSFFVHIWCIP